MTISWFGHACFRVEAHSIYLGQTKEAVSVLIDPFSKDIGLRPPKIKDNLILVTHHHYDHDNIQDCGSDVFVIDGPGEYEKQGVSVRGIKSFHDKSGGSERGLNTIYVIKSEGMTICHMGDFGQDKFEEHQLEEIGNIDILMVPVGGKYTVDYKEAADVVSKIEPKIIIPMHYKVKGLKLDIDGPEKFIKEIGLKPETVDKFKIVNKNLPVDETKLILFQN